MKEEDVCPKNFKSVSVKFLKHTYPIFFTLPPKLYTQKFTHKANWEWLWIALSSKNNYDYQLQLIVIMIININ